jgi:hypothetical protein
VCLCISEINGGFESRIEVSIKCKVFRFVNLQLGPDVSEEYLSFLVRVKVQRSSSISLIL